MKQKKQPIFVNKKVGIKEKNKMSKPKQEQAHAKQQKGETNDSQPVQTQKKAQMDAVDNQPRQKRESRPDNKHKSRFFSCVFPLVVVILLSTIPIVIYYLNSLQFQLFVEKQDFFFFSSISVWFFCFYIIIICLLVFFFSLFNRKTKINKLEACCWSISIIIATAICLIAENVFLFSLPHCAFTEKENFNSIATNSEAIIYNNINEITSSANNLNDLGLEIRSEAIEMNNSINALTSSLKEFKADVIDSKMVLFNQYWSNAIIIYTVICGFVITAFLSYIKRVLDESSQSADNKQV